MGNYQKMRLERYNTTSLYKVFNTKLRFNSEYNGQSLETFKPEDDRIMYMCLEDHLTFPSKPNLNLKF